MAKGRLRLGFLVFLLFTGLIAGSVAVIHHGLGQSRNEIQSSESFSAGWAMALSHPALLDAMGVPQLASFSVEHFRDFIAGERPWVFDVYTKDVPEATERGIRTRRVLRNEIEVPIVGPRGTGSLVIHASKDTGDWTVEKLVAELRGHWQPLDLLVPAPKDKVTSKAEGTKPRE